MEKIIVKSEAETAAFAKKFAESLKPGDIIAFKGGLGAGKTTFTRYLAKALGYEGEASSPTFAIINEYNGGRLNVYHFDMYRIKDEDDLYSIGFYDYFDRNGICLVEWSENIESALPNDTIYVIINKIDDTTREIIIKQKGEQEVEEGCLSFPNKFAKIVRPKEVTVRALNEKGEKLSFIAEHYYAREICHEVDHLDGILIVDREECE